MKIVIGATTLLFLAMPVWAQDAPQHAQHPHPPSSSAPADKAPAPPAHGEAGMHMDAMKHCKMMQQTGEVRPMDKSAGKEPDCRGMHHEMNKSGSGKPRH